MSSSIAKHVLVGTAGHIDHGKTRLVARLTGINTDRLPEEKVRGISIDLGFAHWDHNGIRFGMVDVPGHERFVHNMVAGATGVNAALLVVAADDSVMPQTREHLEIMDLLGLRTGVIAITKTDLVEPDFVELVQAEIEDLVAGTFLAGCPIIAVSAETGAGLDALREALAAVVVKHDDRTALDVFRMPIDRVFSIEGHGTIVTGSVLHGEVHAGDRLELLPAQIEVRARSVQNHGLAADDSGARQRTAINIAGLKTADISRGHELATPGFLQPTRRLLVELRALADSPVTLKDRLELNLHLGTSETVARVALKGRQLPPGESGYGELRLAAPVVAAWGQRFILRRISPALTIAGGRIVDPGLEPFLRLRDTAACAQGMSIESPIDRLSFLLSRIDQFHESSLHALWRVGLSADEYAAAMRELLQTGVLCRIGSGDRALLVHRDRLRAIAQSVMRTIRMELDRHQARRSLPRNTLLTVCREIARPEVIGAVFEHLVSDGQLAAVGDNLGPADAQLRLTKKQTKARDEILSRIRAAGLSPPTLKELMTSPELRSEDIPMLLNVCCEDTLLVQVSTDLWFAPSAIETARQQCQTLLQDAGSTTMASLRDAWGVTRKFALPLGEFFDAQQVTIRQDDLRIAGPNIAGPM